MGALTRCTTSEPHGGYRVVLFCRELLMHCLHRSSLSSPVCLQKLSGYLNAAAQPSLCVARGRHHVLWPHHDSPKKLVAEKEGRRDPLRGFELQRAHVQKP